MQDFDRNLVLLLTLKRFKDSSFVSWSSFVWCFTLSRFSSHPYVNLYPGVTLQEGLRRALPLPTDIFKAKRIFTLKFETNIIFFKRFIPLGFKILTLPLISYPTWNFHRGMVGTQGVSMMSYSSVDPIVHIIFQSQSAYHTVPSGQFRQLIKIC